MDEIVLSLKNVEKTLGAQKVLKNINLEIKKGEVYGLIGGNSAGKTTIMRMITNLSEPTSGKITLFGKNKYTKEYSDILQRVGSVIETPAVFTNLSAYQNMKIVCIQKGIHDFSVIHELLTYINLSTTKNEKIKHFSLGMRQRLSVAMALVGNPDLLILDEPFNVLDPVAIIELRDIIKQINREKNITILISSHKLTELYQVSTRFGFIHKGIMLQELKKSSFDSLNREKIIVKVDDINKASVLLKDNSYEHLKIVREDEIHILHSKKTVSEVNRLLVTNDIDVNYIGKKEGNLEHYYADLVNIEGE